jgi:hypothetical protein
MELCTPTWLNHDYGDGGVVEMLAVDAYFGVKVCMPIFLDEASKIFFFWVANDLKKNSKLNWTHPLTKFNTNKSCYVDNIWLWYECV